MVAIIAGEDLLVKEAGKDAGNDKDSTKAGLRRIETYTVLTPNVESLVNIPIDEIYEEVVEREDNSKNNPKNNPKIAIETDALASSLQCPTIESKPPRNDRNCLSLAQELTGRYNFDFSDADLGRIMNSVKQITGATDKPFESVMDTLPKSSCLRLTRNQNQKNEKWNKHIKALWKRNRFKYRSTFFFRDMIQDVEGRFGSSVVVFLVFVRYLLLTDIVLSMLWIGMIAMPQIIYRPWLEYLRYNSTTDANLNNEDFMSWLYYGSYQRVLSNGYQLALMYILAVILTYYCGFLIIVRSAGKALEEECGASFKDAQYTFSSFVLASWNYLLQTKDATNRLKLDITNILRDTMSEKKEQEKRREEGGSNRTCVIFRNSMAWIITLILIGLGSAAITIGTKSSNLTKILKSMNYNESMQGYDIITAYEPTIIFIIVNKMLPICIFRLSCLEIYSRPKTQLHVSIGRVFILYTVNILSLVLTTYNDVKDKETTDTCPGNLIGQALFKLVVIETIMGIFGTSIPALFCMYILKRTREFDVANNVLKVIHRQALIWMGTLVCPMMPLLGAVSMTILFVTDYYIITRTCHPPIQRWNQSNYSSFFLGLAAATLFTLIIPITLVITRVGVVNLGAASTISEPCGPFGNESMTHEMMRFTTSYDTWVANVLDIVMSPTTILPAVFLMLAIIYYQTMLIRRECTKKKILKDELAIEREQNRNFRKYHRESTFASTWTNAI